MSHFSGMNGYYGKMQPFLKDVEKYMSGSVKNGILDVTNSSKEAAQLMNGHHFETLKREIEQMHNAETSSIGKGQSDGTVVSIFKPDSQLHALPQVLSASIIPRVLFEVLPPLVTHTSQGFVYQNLSSMSGMNFDWKWRKLQLPQLQNGRCLLKYSKGLPLTKCAFGKQTDKEIVFEEQVTDEERFDTQEVHNWGTSRISWLLELERRQELRVEQLKNPKPIPKTDDEEQSVLSMFCCIPFRRSKKKSKLKRKSADSNDKVEKGDLRKKIRSNCTQTDSCAFPRLVV